jgi:putative ABC transport system ATP-binding protein
MTAVIELLDVHKVYETDGASVAALRGVSLRVDKGEFVTIIGASGSGKSTLLNIIGCLDHPSQGTYRLDGQDVAKLDRTELAHFRNRKLGFIFQGFNLLKRYSALDNVALPLVYAGVSPTERRRRARELLELVGLGKRLEHRPSQLSGGEQQRAAIARSLVNQPQILLADEPTGNLDSRNGADILAVISHLHRDLGQTIVMVTHDPVIAGFARRVVTVRDGLIVSDQPNTPTPAPATAPPTTANVSMPLRSPHNP